MYAERDEVYCARHSWIKLWTTRPSLGQVAETTQASTRRQDRLATILPFTCSNVARAWQIKTAHQKETKKDAKTFSVMRVYQPTYLSVLLDWSKIIWNRGWIRQRRSHELYSHCLAYPHWAASGKPLNFLLSESLMKSVEGCGDNSASWKRQHHLWLRSYEALWKMLHGA